MGRLDEIREFLIANRGGRFSVQEICSALGLPGGPDAHPVYSSFHALRKAGLVDYILGPCSISKTKVRLYTWVGQVQNPAAAGFSQYVAGPTQAKKSDQKFDWHQPKPPPPPPPEPKLSREEQERATLKRAAAAAAASSRAEQAAAAAATDRVARARLTFQILTGFSVEAASLQAVKHAYRKACLILHPDRGGDPVKAAELNAAWTELAKSYG